MFDLEDAEGYLLRRFGNRSGYVAYAYKINGEHIENANHRIEWPGLAPTFAKDVIYQLNFGTKFSKKIDVYICPTLRSSGDRRNVFNELKSGTVFADLDGGSIPDDLLPWTELVDSGTPGHYHAYINLTEPVELDRIEALNYALKTVSKGDHKWRENTILRLPGTINTKNGNRVRTEKLAEKSIKAESLETYLQAYMPNQERMLSMRSRQVPEFAHVPMPRNLPHYVHQLLDEESVVGKRSQQAYHFINVCFENGLNYNQVGLLAHAHAPTMDKFSKRLEWLVFTVMNKRLAFQENIMTWLPQKKN